MSAQFPEWLNNWLRWLEKTPNGYIAKNAVSRTRMQVLQLEDRITPVFLGGVSVAAGDINADGFQDIVTGPGLGGGPHVRVFSGENGQSIGDFFAYDTNMTSGINIAVGDVTGDMKPDIITGPGIGGGPLIRVFDGSSFALVGEFFAFDSNFRGGISIAVGDIDGNGTAEIVTGMLSNSSDVRVFSASGSAISTFSAFAPGFAGGSWVATTDLDGDKKSEIIVGSGGEGATAVRVMSGDGQSERLTINPYEPEFAGGVHVSGGDVDGDGFGDVITSPDFGGGPRVRVFNGKSAVPFTSPIANFFSYTDDFRGGALIAVADLDQDGRTEIITGAGRGGSSHVRAFRSEDREELANFIAYDPETLGAGFSKRNTPPSSSTKLSEGDGFTSETSQALALKTVTQGTRTLSFDIFAALDRSDKSGVEDVFNVYIVDAADRSKTLIDRGVQGTSVLSLVGDQADLAVEAGVRFDGRTVQIDVTNLVAPNGANLILQLVNLDADTGSKVEISTPTYTENPDGVVGPRFPQSESIALKSGAAFATVDTLTAAESVRGELTNVRFDPNNATLAADLVVENRGSNDLGRNLVVRFNDLSAGVSLANASGTDGAGKAYLNLREAVPVGGLGQGERTRPVEVRFLNPDRKRFTFGLSASAGENAKPVIGEPDGPLVVRPGEILTRTISLSDADGDPLTISARRSDDSALPDFPVFSLDPSGKLKLVARPDQVGTYELILTVSDGAATVSRTVTLEIQADPDTRTRISGRLLNTDDQPLATVRIAVGSKVTTTDPEGNFVLPLDSIPNTAVKLSIFGNELVSPVAYHHVEMVLNADNGFLGRKDIFVGANNRIANPIYLQALDLVNAVVVDPSQDTIVRSTVDGLRLTIPAGSLRVLQPGRVGPLYTGKVSLSIVKDQKTPMPISREFLPDYVITFHPVYEPGQPRVELQFDKSRPGQLLQPYDGPLPEGTAFDLIGFDEDGVMKKLGDAKIIPTPVDPTAVPFGTASFSAAAVNTPSGSTSSIASTTNESGLRSGACDFFTPQKTPVDASKNPKNPEEGCNADVKKSSGSSMVELHSGTLTEDHTAATYQSLGVTRGVTLRYDSLRADPRPIINFASDGFSPLGESVVPDVRLTARLGISRGTTSTTASGAAASPLNPNGGEHFWRIAAGQTSYQAALQADLRNSQSGRYTYNIEAGLLVKVRERLRGRTSQETGTFISVNSTDSPFGVGWGINGLQHLVIEPDQSVLLIDGDGTQHLFQSVADEAGKLISFQAPPGDFSTLERTPEGLYRRTLPDQTTYLFNADFDLESMRDRNGNTTTFRYSAPRRITEMTDPVGLKTTFTYGTNNKVSEIVLPDGRKTTMTYDAVGNLNSVKDPDGATRTWSYDVDHRMTGERDARGNREASLYNFSGRVVEARRKDGSIKRFSPVQSQALYSPERTTSFDNAPLAQTSTPAEAFVADANGNVEGSTLDRAGQVVQSRNWEGNQSTFVRNTSNLVTRSNDARGNFVNFNYDAKGNVLTRQDVEDQVQILAHNSNSPALYKIDPLNANVTPIGELTNEDGRNVTLFDIAYRDGSGYFGVSSDGVIYRIDPTTAKATSVGTSAVSGLVALAFSPDGVLFAAGNRLYTIDQSTGKATPQGTNTFDGRRASGDIEFGSNGNLFITLTGNGGSDLATVDRNSGSLTLVGKGIGAGFGEVFGLATSFAGLFGLTANGQLINIDTTTGKGTLVAPFGGSNTVSQIGGGTVVVSAPGPRRRMAYDPTFSQLTEMVDEVGHRTLYDIDPSNGNLLKSTRVMNLLDGTAGDAEPDLVTTYTYNTRGQVLTMTDPLGRVTANEYDELGRLTSITSARGSADETTSRYEYFDGTAGRSGNVNAMIDGRGNRTEYEYDAMNRVVKVTEADPDASGPQLSPVTEMKYDENGNLVESKDALGSISTFSYDSMNRRNATVAPDPDGTGLLTSPVSRMTYEPNGNLRSVINPNGNATEYRYDERLRRTQTIDPDGGVTRFRYDLDNNLVSLQDPGGNLTQFVYDYRGRQTAEIDPLGKTTTYVYDAADRLEAMTDRLGRTIDYSFDDANRMIREEWVGGGNAVNYRYDVAGNLVLVEDVFSKLAFTPDALNRTTAVDNAGTPGAPQMLLGYEYDDNGNVTFVRDRINGAEGATTKYEYDALDRLFQESQTGPNVAEKRVEFGYNALGQYTKMGRFLGSDSVVSTEFVYDDMHRLKSITHVAAADQVQFFNYAYDSGSRITQIASKTDTANYGYDKRDQLTGADYAGNSQTDENYRYDANGNRLESQRHGTGYETEPNTANRLKSDGTYNYEYDANGNQTKRTTIADGATRVFTWDYRNRLTKLTDTSAGGILLQEVSFVYDAMDRRIAKSSGGVTTHFVYDREDVLLDFVGTTLDTRYFHGPGIDQILSQEKASGVQWLLTDHLGSTRAVVGAGGTQLVEYDAYGNPSGALPSRYGFTGREFDVGTNLYYSRSRFLDTSIGRFNQEDSLGFASGDSSLYRYVGNSPLRFSDPYGKSPYYPGDTGSMIRAGEALGELLEFFRDAFGADFDFWQNYWNMRNANTIGADKYFHCMANCLASRRGIGGQIEAYAMSEIRELFDQYIKGDNPAACNADRNANNIGSAGGRTSNSPCDFVCSGFRPASLPTEY